MPKPPAPDIEPSSESVAGEEDPGAAVDPAARRPGDEAPAGTPGTGENICRECGGRGVTASGQPCPTCKGTGRVTVGIGGA
jgi:hypothetical protein